MGIQHIVIRIISGVMETMRVLCTIPFLLLAISAESKVDGGYRILNGQPSRILPYQVRLIGCGGTLIALDWVLTAKHCVVKNWEKKDFRPNPDTVWAGIANLKNKQRAAIRNVPVSSIILHDSADLALLRIDPPFEENDDIKPIQINDIKRNLKGKYVLISGWGSTTTKSPSTNQLQSVSLKVTKQAIMPPPYGEVIQMLSSKGKGACYGDSGGPAVLTGYVDLLVGISSAIATYDSNKQLINVKEPNHCGRHANNGVGYWPYQESSYVDVFVYANWIKNKMKNPTGECFDVNPEACSSYKRRFGLPWFKHYCRDNRAHDYFGKKPLGKYCAKECGTC